MSLLKSIKQQLGLGPAAENHFWDGSVANQLSLKRGTPDAPGAELIKAVGDALSFPSQGQLLTNNGYVKLPGGLVIQWGNTGAATGTFPIPFPNAPLRMLTSLNWLSTQAAAGSFQFVQDFNQTGFTLGNAASSLSPPGSVSWIAIGH